MNTVLSIGFKFSELLDDVSKIDIFQDNNIGVVDCVGDIDICDNSIDFIEVDISIDIIITIIDSLGVS